ncbi:MAG: hypothetical protein KIT84_14065 [Labilithrix sp.]|nr:hypothetical protein [Labilithrix sp.]
MHMDVENQVAGSIRAEERLRSGSDIKAAETEINPLLRYDYIWKNGTKHFVALYNPRLIYTRYWDRRFPNPNRINPNTLNQDDPNDQPFSQLHKFGAGYEQIAPRWRLSLYGYGAYGTISTTALLVQDPWVGEGPPPDPNPIVPSTIGARFTLIFAQVQAFVPIKLSARTALIPGATYNAFGGADEPSRGVIAFTRGPGASLQLDHMATREDRLITTLGGALIDTTFQQERDATSIYRSELLQGWRHYFSDHLTSEIAVGASLGGDAINGFNIFSSGQAWIVWDSWTVARVPPGAAPFGAEPGRKGHLQIGAVAKVGPWIDIFSGDLEQRAITGVAMNYGLGRFAYRAYLSQGRVINTPRSVAQYQIVLGETGVRYNIIPEVAVDAGLRVGYQDFDNAIRFNQLTQITAFAGLTYTPLMYHWNP